MMNIVNSVDGGVFNFINVLPHNGFLDLFFGFLSGIGTWGFVWLLLMLGLIVWEEIKDKKELFTLGMALASSFILVDLVIKNLIKRPRPIVAMPPVEYFGYVSTYSFPSGHATMAFAGAYILSSKHKRWRLFYYALAILISLSRLYLERHFVSDIIAGAIIGTVIGYGSIIFANNNSAKKKKVVSV